MSVLDGLRAAADAMARATSGAHPLRHVQLPENEYELALDEASPGWRIRSGPQILRDARPKHIELVTPWCALVVTAVPAPAPKADNRTSYEHDDCG